MSERRGLRALCAKVPGFLLLTALAAAFLTMASCSGSPVSRSSAHGGRTWPVTADAALAAFNRAFLTTWDDAAYYRLTTAGDFVTFFKQAELIEMIEDAWLRTHKPVYRSLIGRLYNGLVARHGSDWLRNPSNDDLMWAAVMCLRAYSITGERAYLIQAKTTFDGTWARAWSASLGGGLWNTTARRSKNTCVVAPAVIAACMLDRSLHDRTYRQKAKRLFGWLEKTLYDPANGAVYDHVSGPGASSSSPGVVVDRSVYSYNQGGFIGAADLLYRITGERHYFDLAVRALRFAMDRLTVGDVLRGETTASDSKWASAGGFKGMFVRWASMFLRHNRIHAYDPWFRRNVAAVRRHANADGLIDERWPERTGGGVLAAFSCSSAVVLLQWYPPS